MPELTTTSYAILGLLALRPHTAYELAAQSGRSLRFLWPTAKSRLYAEPKRLVTLGLIDVTTEASGKVRTRQRFHLTAEGRTALRDWLMTEPAPPRFEAEVLLRAFLADAGDVDDLRAALAATREHVAGTYQDGMALLAAYQEGANPYPERLHLNLLWIVLLRDVLRLIDDWAAFADDEVDGWTSIADPGDRSRLDALVAAIIAGEPVIPRAEGPGPGFRTPASG